MKLTESDLSTFKRCIKNHEFKPYLDRYLVCYCGEIFQTMGKKTSSFKIKYKSRYDGYVLVSFTVNKKQIHRYLHRVIGELFVEKKDRKFNCINHKDGNKSNNCIDNLEWIDHKGNIQHAKNVLGTIYNGNRRWNAKLDPEKIKEMRQLLDSGVSSYIVGPMFGVSQVTASNIKLRRAWAHIK